SEPESNFTVSGKVVYNGYALSNALVSLDNIANYSTTTDVDGKFVIPNIPKGNYQLSVSKNLAEGSFTEITKNVAVNVDLDLTELILPKAVFLFPLSNVTSSSCELFWSATDAVDFREYKIYRHTTPGLDETTGTLIYVATSISDTSFVDRDIFEATTYYYRVFVMNEYGRLGGSNIESTKTLNRNLIINGDFELFNSKNEPLDWLLENDVWFTNDQNFQSGAYGLRGERNSYLYELGPGASLRQFIPYTSIVAGKQYTFSFHYYVENLGGNSTLQVALRTRDQSSTIFIYDYFITGQSTTGWESKAFTFTAPTLTQDLVVSCFVGVNIPYDSFKVVVYKIENLLPLIFVFTSYFNN
ncbi:MAG: carboxypeptidase regulatory-like domain-containing protein, partial [Ignavibacteriaceae bacterium]